MNIEHISQNNADSDQSLSELVYREIKKNIAYLVYQPNSFLSEATLAEELHVSKMPIKLAVRRLENEGWLIADFRRKIRVKDISAQDIKEIFQLRWMLEGDALKQIFAEDKTWEYSFRLEEKLLKIKAARKDYFAHVLAERLWHMELVCIFNNERIERIYRNLHEEAVRIAAIIRIAQLKENDKAYEGYSDHIINGLERFIVAMREKRYEEARDILHRDHSQGAMRLALDALDKK
jgi:DNA-binding GntR family transcriptional regulator